MTKNSGKQKHTILLVEDDDHLIFFLQKLLHTAGYDVILANNGKQAVELYKENINEIDLLVLDLVLPDFMGDVVYDEIRKINPDILLLLMSGFPRESFKNIEGLHFIKKPMYSSEFLNLIQQIIDGAESAPTVS